MSGSPTSEAHFAPGYRLDRYELLCPVAQGGMAAVWLARMRGKHGFEKLVAIKTILPIHAETEQFRRMFLDEAAIASRIEHGNVAQILDLGEHEGTLYLVMEWVDGESLSRIDRAVHAAGEQIPLGIGLRVAADACAGLHAAHELADADGHSLGVVHRDVSPQNVLISAKGVVKVIDFGIAKARGRVSEETNAGTLKGKIHYMAPEQALGQPVDRRSDVWAVGALLYRVLAQRPVYDGENQLATLHSLTSNERPKPLPNSVPESVARIVLQALAFDPEQRYQSCGDLQAALESVMVAESVGASVRELAAFVQRHAGQRIESRRKTLQAAVEAANERSALRALQAAEATESAVGAPPIPGRPPSFPPPHEGSLTSSSAALDTQGTSSHEPASRRWVALGAIAASAILLTLIAARHFSGASSPTGKLNAADPSGQVPPVTLSAEPASTTNNVVRPAPSASAAANASAAPPTLRPPAQTTSPVVTKHVAPTNAAHAKPRRKRVDDGF